jgi:excisionase family DNA binding protein
MSDKTQAFQSTNAEEPLAYRVDDAKRVLGIGRTSVYKLISNGQLRAVKVAGRTVIDAASARSLIANAPQHAPSGTLAAG